MNAQRAALIYDGEDVERCRQARRALEKQFKTLDALMDHCEGMRKKHAAAMVKGSASRKNARCRAAGARRERTQPAEAR